MEDLKIINRKQILKWILIGLLLGGCVAGIIYEAVSMGLKTQTAKLGGIHIMQYATMAFCVVLPVILEKLKLKVGIVVWVSFYIFIFLAVFVGSILKVYDKFAQFDVVVHTLSGVILALFALSLVKELKNPFVCLLCVVSIAVLLGVLWEFYEFSFDHLLKLNMQRTSNPYTGEAYIGKAAIYDTMLDLFCDFAGALVSGIICIVFRKKLGNSLLITKKQTTSAQD